MVSGFHYDKDDEETSGCSCARRSSRHQVDQDAILDLLWQYVVNDTVVTLREASNK